ncbi:MAG: M14 family zinc carboxypeptidase [Bacteroidales bacterium]
MKPGGEASLLTAYYLVASLDEEMDEILDNSVIFIEPIFNPDGRKVPSWVNMNKGKIRLPIRLIASITKHGPGEGNHTTGSTSTGTGYHCHRRRAGTGWRDSSYGDRMWLFA